MKKEIMYEVIYGDLKKAIESQELAAGSKLPSEKELQEKYHVSRITAKHAMDLLAREHYIVRTPGRGSFINQNIEDILGAEEIFTARREAKTKRKCISVIFDNFGSDFGSVLLQSIEQECSRRKCSMVFHCSYGSIPDEAEAIEHALDMEIDGMIIMCAQGEVYSKEVLQLAFNNFPLVLVDRELTGINIPCVKTDNYTSARELTETLVLAGHKKIIFVTHGTVYTSTINERYQGFCDCILSYPQVTGDYYKIEHYNTAPKDIDREYRNIDFGEYRKLLEEHPDCTAFFAAEYKLAAILDRVAKELGREIEIVTFDGLDSIYGVEDRFTYIKQDEYRMGKEAVKLVWELMEGKALKQNILIPHRVVRKNRNAARNIDRNINRNIDRNTDKKGEEAHEGRN